MNSTAAIYARLNSQAGIKSRLDVHNSKPAIFNDRAPDAFVFGEKAAVVIAAPTRDEPDDTLTEFGREVVQDIRIYAKDTGSTAVIDQLARDIRDLFHTRPSELTVDGGSCSLATATGPVAAPTTDPSLIGRRVTLRLLLERN